MLINCETYPHLPYKPLLFFVLVCAGNDALCLPDTVCSYIQTLQETIQEKDQEIQKLQQSKATSMEEEEEGGTTMGVEHSEKPQQQQDDEDNATNEPPFPPMYDSSSSGAEDYDKAGDFKQEAADLKGNGDWQGALDKYTQAVLAAPPSALLYANRALALLKLGRPNAAERDCDAALKENPDSAKVRRKERIIEQNANM